MKNHVEAEEIVHQVCFKILNRKKTSIIEDLDGYVIVSIKNTSFKKIERQKTIKDINISELIENRADADDDYMVSMEREKKLNKAISELPNSSREIFELCVIEGKKYRSVAEHMNLSINTIKYHIKKSYKILRLKLIDN